MTQAEADAVDVRAIMQRIGWGPATLASRLKCGHRVATRIISGAWHRPPLVVAWLLDLESAMVDPPEDWGRGWSDQP